MSVVLLCHLDGTNGQTTTVDSSGLGHALTMNLVTLSTTSPKFGTASADFASAGSTAVITSPDSADWHFGTNQFTIESFVKFTSAPGAGIQGIATQFGGSTNLGWFFGMVSGSLSLFYSTTGTDFPSIGASFTPTLNQWYHLAVDRDASNVIRVYVDGVVIASATVSSSFFNSTRLLSIGNDDNADRKLTGFIDELRINNGTAEYGGAFTPPTEPFPDPEPESEARITQAALLVLDAPEADARMTQACALVLSLMPDAADGLRMTQATMLALAEFEAGVRMTQTVALVLADQVNCLTRWAQTWTITRTDGVVFGYTSHDMPVMFRGVLHSPCSSLAASAVEMSSLAGTVGNMDLDGIIADDAITTEDLYNGLFDGALVEVWVVPWDNAAGDIPFRLMGGTVGKTGQGLTGYTLEVLAEGTKLQQKSLVDVYTPGCRYNFGNQNDSRCPVDLGTITVSGSVTTAAIPNASNYASRRIFTDSSRAEADDFFNLGKLTWTGGANTGAVSEIKSFAGGTFVLWQEVLVDIAVTDTYDAHPGCDKSRAGHLLYNADMIDFGGFEDVPGDDSVFATPDAK